MALFQSRTTLSGSLLAGWVTRKEIPLFQAASWALQAALVLPEKSMYGDNCHNYLPKYLTLVPTQGWPSTFSYIKIRKVDNLPQAKSVFGQIIVAKGVEKII